MITLCHLTQECFKTRRSLVPTRADVLSHINHAVPQACSIMVWPKEGTSKPITEHGGNTATAIATATDNVVCACAKHIVDHYIFEPSAVITRHKGVDEVGQMNAF
jgi:hypothetical protein